MEAESEGAAERAIASVPAPSLAVPASLHASLMARLDRLGPAKEVAQIGAAIGREFSHTLISAVAHKPEAELGSALALIEALSGSYVLLDNLNTRLLLGQEIDLSEHAATVSAIVRVSSRLGLRRRAKDITPPSVAEYLAHVGKQKEGAAP